MPSRILFNGLKHHAQIIRDFIHTYDAKSMYLLEQQICSIGNSQMDLYTGNLSETTIKEEVITQLTRANLLSEVDFKEFLHPEQFRSVFLSDGSSWILRFGERTGQYIHIHPARYSMHTIRVKATTLKTAIGVLIWQKETISELDIKQLNYLRKDILKLSPIRSLEDVNSVWKVVNMLIDKG
ncbi:hypothetical protein QNI19_00265 [Cytophagaceae bacterium DM2B3-1]|uniref:Uncharacterized protein n=2 Tax=Xanthocytophaga flava TaxID=3048013 RepID=A0ABT7CCK3_9BACT|nr:hypothetical protein [Xanthocytophaga flavus]MDJ1470100.1 hypothetical protein [Xanthocytophaga flavus]MDJ1491337.1 hypothetical protein [Xanthocytophaga flavus]